MKYLKNMSLFQKVLSLLIVLQSLSAPAEDINMYRLSSHSLSEWHSIFVPENTRSFLMELHGVGNTTYQITDLIAPDGTYFVRSHLRENPFQTPLTGREHPYMHNMRSLNRSLSVIDNYSALLVPNFYTEDALPTGQWRYRVFAMKHTPDDKVQLKMIFTSTKRDQRVLRLRVLIEANSFWDLNPQYLQETLTEAERVYNRHNISFEIQTEKFTPLQLPHGEAPAAITQVIQDLDLKNSSQDGTILFLMLSRMTTSNKPINGLACLAGLYSKSGCFTSMFADALLAPTVTSVQAGKIFAHELGHYLGLFHTQDQDYPIIGDIFDPLEDTSTEILGTNIMDPGIHNEHPEFSPQQIHVLKLHPALHER